MDSILNSLRHVLGTPNFYIDGVFDSGLMLEYFFAGTILCIVVSAIFRILVSCFNK